MSNVKSLDALDINGLAIFKENIVKKYLTPDAAPSVVSQAVYRALQQYKKDVVRFYSAYGNLPLEGNPGTLYLVHKSVDSEHSQIPGLVPKDEIWISSASYETVLACHLGDSYIVDAKKHNIYPFHVLKLADIDPARVTWFAPYQRNASDQGFRYGVYLPDTTTTITTYAQLASLAGKIIAVPLRDGQRNTTILPQLAYTDTIPDKWNVPSDEIWVLSNQNSLTVSVSGWGSTSITHKNQYGYFVLKKGVHFPSTANTNIYSTTIGGSYNVWYNAKGRGMSASLESTNDLEYLYGHIVTRSFIDANYPLWVVYSYQVAERHIEYLDESGDVPADEIWFDPMDWPSMYVSYISSSAGYIPLEKNSRGYYVLPKSMIPSNASCMYLSSVNSNYRSGDLNYHGQDYNTCVIRELCDGRSPCNRISNVEQIYEFLGKCIHVTPGHSSALQIDYALPEDVTVPDAEVWIDPHNWGNADQLYLLNSRSIGSDAGRVRTLSKNEYGYYVLTDLDTLPSAYLIISKDTSTSQAYYDTGTANSTLYLLYSAFGVGGYWTEKEYFQTVVRGKIITTAPHSAIVAQVVGKVCNTRVTYVTPATVPSAEDTSDNKFVAYTYKNGKYVQVSSSLFDTSDLHLEDITDQVLSLTSTNPISNKAVCDGLRYKYDIANILATPVAGYDNLVSSSGIKAALDRLVTWDDIECIPITGEEIHTLFATYKPIPLIAANYYRIVIRGKKVEGANYLVKIFETETLTGLTFVSRSADGPSMSETLSFTEDDTGKYIPVTVTCANKYNSPVQFWPGNLFDESSDGYYRADTSDADMVLTIDIKRKLAMSTLRKLTFTCLAGRPYQTTIPPVEKLTVSVYGSIGGVDYPTFRENIVYTPNKVANDGVYTIDIFPNA